MGDFSAAEIAGEERPAAIDRGPDLALGSAADVPLDIPEVPEIPELSPAEKGEIGTHEKPDGPAVADGAKLPASDQKD
jgi:hypothetical protein